MLYLQPDGTFRNTPSGLRLRPDGTFENDPGGGGGGDTAALEARIAFLERSKEDIAKEGLVADLGTTLDTGSAGNLLRAAWIFGSSPTEKLVSGEYVEAEIGDRVSLLLFDAGYVANGDAAGVPMIFGDGKIRGIDGLHSGNTNPSAFSARAVGGTPFGGKISFAWIQRRPRINGGSGGSAGGGAWAFGGTPTGSGAPSVVNGVYYAADAISPVATSGRPRFIFSGVPVEHPETVAATSKSDLQYSLHILQLGTTSDHENQYTVDGVVMPIPVPATNIMRNSTLYFYENFGKFDLKAFVIADGNSLATRNALLRNLGPLVA